MRLPCEQLIHAVRRHYFAVEVTRAAVPFVLTFANESSVFTMMTTMHASVVSTVSRNMAGRG